jgi:hypothetical protein
MLLGGVSAAVAAMVKKETMQHGHSTIFAAPDGGDRGRAQETAETTSSSLKARAGDDAKQPGHFYRDFDASIFCCRP